MAYRQDPRGQFSEGRYANSAVAISEYGVNGFPVKVKFGICLWDTTKYESKIGYLIIT
jgi:hypothetical protein